MLNPMQHRLIGAAGLRGLTTDDAGNVIYVEDTPVGSTSTGHSTRDAVVGMVTNLTPLFLQAFGKRPVYSITGQTQQTTTQQLTATQQAALVAQAAATSTSGVGFGFDSQGLRLSEGSHIGWVPLALGAGALFLLQSKGLSRK